MIASNAAQGNTDKILIRGRREQNSPRDLHHQRKSHLRSGVRRYWRGRMAILRSQCMAKSITPNQHKLARQFGILDNFYDSGDVSGDGHVWSTSASISDYVEKTWPIGYRGHEHTYDSEGQLLGGIAVEDGLPDAEEPTGGYLWKNFAKHGISYRHYGEYIVTRWCNETGGRESAKWPALRKLRASRVRGE